MVGFEESVELLRSVSLNIMAKALPIMKSFADGRSDVVQSVATKRNVSYNVALALCQDVVLAMIEDARRVSSEIQNFNMKTLEDDDGRKTQFNFLRQVWFGDVYAVEGVDGLQKLYSDMLAQSESLTVITIVSEALKRPLPTTTVVD